MPNFNLKQCSILEFPRPMVLLNAMSGLLFLAQGHIMIAMMHGDCFEVKLA